MTNRARRVTWVLVGALLGLLLLGFGVAPRVVGSVLNRTLDGADADVGPEAVRIQGTLAGADLHSDALLWDRDLLTRGSWGSVDVPHLIEGRMAVQLFTVVTKSPYGMNIESNTADSDMITLLAVLQRWPTDTWGSLAERALLQADELQRFSTDSEGRLAFVRSREELEGFLAHRDADEETVAGILGLEGTHALEGDLSNVGRLFQAGFRMFGLVHFFDTEVGGSAHGVDKGGLTDFGVQVLDRMDELGILVDLAHAAPELIDDVLARTSRPVVVSHTGVKGTCDNPRNLDDDRLAAIGATGGVVGIGLWEEAVCGTTTSDWARAVRHAVDVAGVDHVGLGSDWDGAVRAVADASQTVHLTQALLDEGFSDPDVRKIMGENVIRLLLQSLPPQSPTP